MTKPLSIQERLAQARANLTASNAEPKDTAVNPVVAPQPASFALQPAIKSVVDLSNVDEGTPYRPFKEMLLHLEQQLNDEVPDFSQALRELHTIMSDDPNVVTVLSDEEIGLIVRGFKRHTDITISTSPKRTSTKRTQLTKAALDNLEL